MKKVVILISAFLLVLSYSIFCWLPGRESRKEEENKNG
jgi:hypothetical protein